MTLRWEYLTLAWQTAAKEVFRDGKATWEFDAAFSIARPGAKPERRGGAEELPSLLNDLGADGWELVSALVGSSRVGVVYGWQEASAPVAMTWIFKRPATTLP